MLLPFFAATATEVPPPCIFFSICPKGTLLSFSSLSTPSAGDSLRTRAPRIAAWFNVYLQPSATLVDIIPQIGGRWGHRPDADLNLAVDRRHRDSCQRHFTHNRPLPQMTDIPPEKPGYLQELVARAIVVSSTGEA